MEDSKPTRATADELINSLSELPVWPTKGDFSDSEWERYLNVAKLLQGTDPQIVEEALNRFVSGASRDAYSGSEPESKAFILMRLVFDLPETAPAEQRQSFKGWTNWPEPDSSGNVSLAWPVSWSTGRPRLIAPYEGSMGKPYAASLEFRYLLNRFPYRPL